MSNEIQDLKEMTSWLKKEIKDIDDSVKNKTVIIKDYSHSKLPTLATLLTFNENEINKLPTEAKKRYTNFISTNKETIATVTSLNIGTAAISGVGLGLRGIAGVGGLGFAGVGALGFGFLNPGILGAVIGFAAYRQGKKFLERNRKAKDYEEVQHQLTLLQAHCQTESTTLKEILQENCKQLGTLFNTKLKKAMEITKENSKKIAIQIDDAMNTDVNKRIMQYQEIALNQYKNQALLQENINQIIEAYNNLVKENERLVSQIQEYEAKSMNIKNVEANFLK